MDIPLKLRAKFPNLTADESAELKAFFANLPHQDSEIQRLIEDSMDALIEILLDKPVADRAPTFCPASPVKPPLKAGRSPLRFRPQKQELMPPVPLLR